MGDASVPSLAHRGYDDVLNLASVDEPASFREAEQEESWREAMCAEIKAIEEKLRDMIGVQVAGDRAQD